MATIYTPKKYRDNFHHHLDRIENGETLAGSIATGIKKIDDILIPIGPTDLGVVLANQGHGKCLAKGTKVIMFDGSMKNVEDIQIGDVLMGPDSLPRNVLSTSCGREQMYWIKQNKAMDYRVNESHILSLKYSGAKRKNEVINVSVKDILKQPNLLSRWMGYKSGVEFEEKQLPLEPYFLGLWLGDGTASKPEITNQDIEILQYIKDYAGKINKRITERKNKKRINLFCVRISNHNGDKTQRPIEMLRNLGVLNNKHIPDCYKYNSSQNRLFLLAGIIDTDGCLEYNGYRIIQKSKQLIYDIKYVADSLGFRTTIREKIVKYRGLDKLYYELGIYGDIQNIPVRVEHKKCARTHQRVNASVTGIKIEKDIIDDYYGFIIDGDHLFLLEDFTVTHNTSFMMHMTFIACEMYNASKDKYSPPIYVTKETAIEELLLRLLSNYATIDIGDIKRNKSYLNWKDMHEYADKMMEEYPIIFIGHSMYSSDTRKTLSAQKVIEDIDRIHQNLGNPSILVDIDYLQRFDWDGESDRRMSLFKCVDGFKDMALESNTTVLLGCQAKREVADRTFPIPMERDALETSNIEHTTDWMVSLLRPVKYWEAGTIIPKSKNNTIVTPDLFYIHILKQRSGEVNIGTYCSFDARVFAFCSIED